LVPDGKLRLASYRSCSHNILETCRVGARSEALQAVGGVGTVTVGGWQFGGAKPQFPVVLLARYITRYRLKDRGYNQGQNNRDKCSFTA
jgi:hypothetical protein